MAPTYQYRYVSHEDREKFIGETYGQETLDNYLRLNIGASQADYWRVLVLYKYGGVYLDIDAHLLWPLERIINPDSDEVLLKLKNNDLTNFFMAGAPGNENFKLVIDKIAYNIDNHPTWDVYSLTGPIALTRALEGRGVETIDRKLNCNQGNFVNKHFQYLDKKDGLWQAQQQIMAAVKDRD